MSFKLPFPTWLLNTPIQVYYEGTNTDGDYVEEKIYDGKCIYTDKTKQIMTADRQLITLSGKAVIQGSIYDTDFEGYVIINGRKKKVYSTEKPINPDGSIYSTELNLV